MTSEYFRRVHSCLWYFTGVQSLLHYCSRVQSCIQHLRRLQSWLQCFGSLEESNHSFSTSEESNHDNSTLEVSNITPSLLSRWPIMYIVPSQSPIVSKVLWKSESKLSYYVYSTSENVQSWLQYFGSSEESNHVNIALEESNNVYKVLWKSPILNEYSIWEDSNISCTVFNKTPYTVLYKGPIMTTEYIRIVHSYITYMSKVQSLLQYFRWVQSCSDDVHSTLEESDHD